MRFRPWYHGFPAAWRLPRPALLALGLGGVLLFGRATLLLAQPTLPERLELDTGAASLPSPEALLEEARQSAARVERPTYGQSVARLILDLQAALTLEKAL